MKRTEASHRQVTARWSWPYPNWYTRGIIVSPDPGLSIVLLTVTVTSDVLLDQWLGSVARCREPEGLGHGMTGRLAGDRCLVVEAFAKEGCWEFLPV